MKRCERRWGILRILVVSMVGLICGAVPPASAGQPPGPGGVRQRMGEWDYREELRTIDQLHEAVRKELDLSQKQIDAIDALFEQHHQATQATIKKIEQGSADYDRRSEQLREELAEARKTRDRDQMRELRMRMRELNAPRMEMRRAQRAFDDEVIAELDGELRIAYRRLAGRIRRPERIPDPARLRTAAIRQALGQLDISDEQQQQLRNPMHTLSKTLAEARRDQEARAAAVTEYRQAVLDILTPQQRDRFDQLETNAAEKRDQKRAQRQQRLDRKKTDR